MPTPPPLPTVWFSHCRERARLSFCTQSRWRWRRRRPRLPLAAAATALATALATKWLWCLDANAAFKAFFKGRERSRLSGQPAASKEGRSDGWMSGALQRRLTTRACRKASSSLLGRRSKLLRCLATVDGVGERGRRGSVGRRTDADGGFCKTIFCYRGRV